MFKRLSKRIKLVFSDKNPKKLKHFKLNANQKTLLYTLLTTFLVISVLTYFGYAEVVRVSTIRKAVSSTETAIQNFLVTNDALKEALAEFSTNAGQGISTSESEENARKLLDDLEISSQIIARELNNINATEINDYKKSGLALSSKMKEYVTFEKNSFELIRLYNETVFIYLSSGETLSFQKPTAELSKDFDNLSKKLVLLSTEISAVISDDPVLSLFKTSVLNLSTILANYCKELSSQFSNYDRARVDAFISSEAPKIKNAESQISSNLLEAQQKEDELNKEIEANFSDARSQYDKLSKDFK